MKIFLSWIAAHRVLAGIIVISAAILAYFFFFREAPVAVTETSSVVAATRGDLRVTVTGSGQVAADAQVDLKPVAAGDAIEVTAVAVKNDQAVKKGELIATIDSEEALRSVRQAELSLKSAKIKMQQTEKEYAARNEDETLVRRAQEVAVKQQELALQKAYSQLSDYSIRAPFDGIVTGLDVEGGDTISQTAVLASVITEELKAVITLNEVDVVKIEVGAPVRLTFNALPDRVISGKIAKLDTLGTLSQGVVSYDAEVTFDKQEEVLRPGMSVTAEVAVAEKNDVVLVPNSALSYQDGQAFVRVAGGRPGAETGTTEGQGRRREVSVGLTDNVMTEIVSGLKEGESVIVTGTGSANRAAGTQGNVLNTLFRGNRSGTR